MYFDRGQLCFDKIVRDIFPTFFLMKDFKKYYFANTLNFVTLNTYVRKHALSEIYDSLLIVQLFQYVGKIYSYT